MAAPGLASESPTTRSKSTAAETSGMRATPMSRPTPFSSRKPTTPSAAARPKALPPVRRRPWVPLRVPMGPSRSVSRVPGEEPRTSTPTTAPLGSSKRTAVQPVAPSRSVAWPTRTPGTSHRLSYTGLVFPGLGGAFRGRDVPVLRVGWFDAGVVAGETPEGYDLLLRALLPDLDDDGVADHRVFDDLAFPLTAELDDGVAERRPLLELLVGVVLVAHATLHLAAAANDLLVRRDALLLGKPDVDGTQVPGPAPGRAAQRQPAGVAPARIARPIQKAEPPERHLGVVGPLEAVLDRAEIGLLPVGLVFDLDVGGVEGDVATYKLDPAYLVVAGELAGLLPNLATVLPVAVLLALIFLGDDAHDVV